MLYFRFLRSTVLGLVLAIGMTFLGGQSASAATHWEGEIEHQGKTILWGSASAPAGADAATYWAKLEQRGFGVQKNRFPGCDEAKTTLPGRSTVVVTALGNPNIVTRVTVDDLRLVRNSAGVWRLADGEVERTAAAGGLELPKRPWISEALIAVPLTWAVALLTEPSWIIQAFIAVPLIWAGALLATSAWFVMRRRRSVVSSAAST